MATILHSALTGSETHEPKGADTASAGEVYVADGTGSGAWQTHTIPYEDIVDLLQYEFRDTAALEANTKAYDAGDRVTTQDGFAYDCVASGGDTVDAVGNEWVAVLTAASQSASEASQSASAATQSASEASQSASEASQSASEAAQSASAATTATTDVTQSASDAAQSAAEAAQSASDAAQSASDAMAGLAMDLESLAVLAGPPKAGLTDLNAASNKSATAEITETYTRDQDTTIIGYEASLLSLGGDYAYTRAKLFDDYTTEAFGKIFRVHVRSKDLVDQDFQIRLISGNDWAGSRLYETVYVTLDADNDYRTYVDFNYSDYSDYYGEAGRPQIGNVAIAFTSGASNGTAVIETYCVEVNQNLDDMSNPYDDSRIGPLQAQVDGLQAQVDLLDPDIDYITCWGDSLTAGGGWTDTLETLSGLPVYNGGTGGENAQTIAARQGGDVMEVNNLTIPATTTSVVIADRDVDAGISTQLGNTVTPLLQSGAHVNPVMIGDVEGTLVWTGSGHSDMTGDWTFTRSEAGVEVSIARPTAIRTDFDMNRNAPLVGVIFMGQNGGYTDNADLITQHRIMIEHSTAKHTVVLGLSSGSASFRAAYEDAMKAAFGRYFISLREYLATPIYDTDGTTILTCYGLDDAGLTPTQADLDAIATGTVPPQMLSDSVHYTSSTKTVIGNMLHKKMRDLGLFTK